MSTVKPLGTDLQDLYVQVGPYMEVTLNTGFTVIHVLVMFISLSLYNHSRFRRQIFTLGFYMHNHLMLSTEWLQTVSIGHLCISVSYFIARSLSSYLRQMPTETKDLQQVTYQLHHMESYLVSHPSAFGIKLKKLWVAIKCSF